MSKYNIISQKKCLPFFNVHEFHPKHGKNYCNREHEETWPFIHSGECGAEKDCSGGASPSPLQSVGDKVRWHEEL